uniref:NADH dehydrogenase subunit 4L n=1 Tax=Ixodes myrmecobii TaxID=262305 RepID=UPI001FF460E4|nr:NADH dehydrogenase subunit 4L [Ixodes myrmecobii]UOK09887.1 NADH dehydrogenase subunit 4L [Ixodes myrmecobii]
MMEISFMMYMVGLLVLLINRSHVMIILLCFEYMYLGIFMTMVFTLIFFSFIKVILYLIVIVCEASLGLGMLVSMNFFYGNDKLSSMVLMKC